MRSFVFVVIAFVALVGCPPSPSPPTPDADASSSPADAEVIEVSVSADVQAACAVLAAAGCPDGGPKCASALQGPLDGRWSTTITPESVACVAHAKPDVLSIRACGPQWCP